MRRHFSEWKKDMEERFPAVKIEEIRHNGGLVGGFASVEEKHVGSWPHYLIPGYQILGPVKGDYA